jgi:hypothetical protein
MMMRTVFTVGLTLISISFASATDLPGSQSEADFALLVRNHGFVAPALPQEAGVAIDAVEEAVAEPVAEQAIVESESAAIAVVEDAAPIVEDGYEAPIINHQHRNFVPQRRPQRGGVFSELIELERRKNAWLKKTFFGR